MCPLGYKKLGWPSRETSACEVNAVWLGSVIKTSEQVGFVVRSNTPNLKVLVRTEGKAKAMAREALLLL